MPSPLIWPIVEFMKKINKKLLLLGRLLASGAPFLILWPYSKLLAVLLVILLIGFNIFLYFYEGSE